MDTLHTVLRSISGETKSSETKHRREHLDVFREFLRHLDRAQKRRAGKSTTRKSRRKR